MTESTNRLGWTMVLEGALMILGGIVVALLPLKAIEAFSIVIGIGLLVVGVMGVFRGLKSRQGSNPSMAPSFFGPILALLLGLLLVAWPMLIPNLLMNILGVFLLVLGAVQLLAGFAFGRGPRADAIKIAGLIAIVLGVLVMIFSEAAMWLFALFFAANLAVNGVITLMAGWRLRSGRA